MSGEKKNLQFFVHGYKGKVLNFFINKNDTIDKLISMVGKEVGLKSKEMILLYAGKQLDSNTAKDQYLDDYDIHNLSTLVLVTRVRGGHKIKAALVPRERSPSPIRYSPKPCIISDEDTDSCKRVKMPCGHAIVPGELKAFCRHKLKKGEYAFKCPLETCKTEWKYSTIRRYACLSEDEMREFEIKISENFAKKHLGDIGSCPSCESICLRDDEKAQRVPCPHCVTEQGKPYFFCWDCWSPWKSGAKDVFCGNEGCDAADPRLEILQQAELVEVPTGRKFKNAQTCPRMRACINCGTLNYFEGGCKRIPCKACKFEFCLICVRPFTSKQGRGECGYSVTCTTAPVQASIVTKRISKFFA